MSSSRTTSRFIVDPIKPSTSSSSGGRLSTTNENSTRSHPTRRYIGSRTTAYNNGAAIPEALTLREKAQKFQELIDEHKKFRGEPAQKVFSQNHVRPLQQNDKKSSANNEKIFSSNSKKHGEIDDNTKKLSNTKSENGEIDNTKKLSKTKSEKEVKLRKPKTFGKDGVRSRTRELVENFFDSLTRRSSNTKSLRRTTSGLAIVAPSSTSTTDPIILGRKDPVKVRKSPSVSASQNNKIAEEINFLTVGKKNPRRLSLMDNLRLPFLNLERKLSREERSDKETASVSNKEKDGSVINREKDASKSLNERVLNNVKNGPFSPNSAPTKRRKSVEFKKGSKEEAIPKISVSVINSDQLRPQEAIPTISVSVINSDELRPQSPREKNESPRTSSKQRPLSLSQMDPNPMPEPPVISTVTPPTPPQIKKSHTSVELVKPPVTTLYEDLYIPRLNRAMTTIGFRHSQLPPLLEGSPLDHGSLADGEQESANEQKETRKPRKYFGSHTTSTYEYGHKDSAPDATERRRLIGFLHRTSHLSLTSELSADASFYLIGHRRKVFEDSTICTESDARVFSEDDESRVSTSTDNITSVSRQHLYRRRKFRRNRRQPSRASSMSSMTETSMALEVITVTLNMDTVNFLGISIVGQSSSRGDNGIYVANIMKGGAVALDGRIEPGDMILQVNDISFENFTNDQAVEVLKEAVSRRGTIKLTVAKSFDSGAKNCFIVPSREPVRPIDTHAWVQHTNNYVMNSIPEGSEGAPTPVPGQFSQYCRPASSSATSNGSGGQQTIVGPAGILQNIPMRLDTKMDKKLVVRAMAMPNSGLDIRNRTWLKIPIPMSFLGSALVDWLMEHVDGLRDRKDGRRYASELLKEKLIAHVVNKITFTEQCYYVFGEECADFVRLRQAEETGSRSDIGSIPAPPPGLPHGIPHGHLQWPSNSGHSMVSEYASMPLYNNQPYMQGIAPNPLMQQQQFGAPDLHSQASGNSNEGSSGSDHRRANRAVLPPAPSLSSVPQSYNPNYGMHPPRLNEMPTILTASRNSFRIACNNCPVDGFFIDHL